jgi:hypothetical protein
MLREHLHRLVDGVFDVPRALLGDDALACRHVRGAHRERLLALRAVVDGALTYFDEKPRGELLVRVEARARSRAEPQGIPRRATPLANWGR